MAKKIYDIKPPRLGGAKVEENLKDFFDADNKEKPARPGAKSRAKETARRKKENRPPWRAVMIAGGVVVLALSAYLFFKLPKADILIWPKTDVLSFKETITGEQSATLVDMLKKIIPVQYLQEEKESSEEFPATGSASNEGKAAGTIRVYNKYDPPTAITLKKGTHFLSDSGKYFVTLQKIVIPAGKKSGGKITSGSIEVKVQAEESGPGYNIKPAKFSVPKLSGTAYYYSIYGESEEAMVGGYTGKVKKVTEDDIQTAKNTLTKKLLSEAETALKGNISSEYILLDNAILSEILSSSSSVKAGTVADKFTYKAKTMSRALIIKKVDLDKFAKDYIFSKMPESKTMLQESFSVNYAAESVDIKGGKMVLNVEFSSKIYQSIDRNSLVSLFRGMSPTQINDSINNSFGDQVSKVKVNLWPFWVTKAPRNQKVIHIDLKFD